MAKPILAVLAAGMGSRYGGLKQLDRVREHGEALLDFSVFDALRSGFGKAVFIVRRDLEADFRELVLKRIGGSIECALAFQERESLIPGGVAREAERLGRTKPWGTTHALLCAERELDAPFAVINADDFYGREAFAAMGAYLRSPEARDGAIVPYRLERTLSDEGTVSRGVCEIAGGYLASVEEHLSLAREGGAVYSTAPGGAKTALPPDTPVSMNFWGFPAGIFPALHRYFGEFLQAQGADPKSECYLPRAADWLIRRGLLRFRALEADAEWFGMTYKADKAAAARRVKELTAAGAYPARLWERSA
ncbi:hypothetical protein [Treponema endosymbiont of Eucomonympha sp.]|uniref:hypothetical protein n=1 Tax=Treponema endosymbiont of Eucomonympha sp. TaxID=1580831 RepID=UPI00078595C3|nr:hypothetical protein [Treponema endosymbiont of Eucomonympha sp.]